MKPLFYNAMNGLSAVFKDAKKSQNHLHRELPYRHFDFTESVFENRTSRGFGLKISVLGGANDELIVSLNNLVTTLPQGKKWDYQLQLVGHNRVGHYIDANEKVMAQRGGILADMAKRDAKYARFAAKQGFFHNQKNNHFDLRDYDAFFFVSTTDKNPEALRDVRSEVETALVQLGFDTLTITPEMLLTHIGDIVNFNPNQDRPIRDRKSVV